MGSVIPPPPTIPVTLILTVLLLLLYTKDIPLPPTSSVLTELATPEEKLLISEYE